jgi:hypothetical protein
MGVLVKKKKKRKIEERIKKIESKGKNVKR